jgi:hypothetical protein
MQNDNKNIKKNIAEELRLVLKTRLDEISKHTYKMRKELDELNNTQEELLSLYQYVQYLERKSFQMRLHIEEHYINSKREIDDNVNDLMKKAADSFTNKSNNKSDMNLNSDAPPF